jgi:hypothetical protein
MIVSFTTLSLSAQLGIGGGFTTLLEFGNKKPFFGLNFVVEYPRNNEVVFYGRLHYLFKNTSYTDYGSVAAFPKDPSIVNYQDVPIQQEYSINYFTIDGGTRYYLINGFDEGFSLYGGANVGLIFNKLHYFKNYRLGEYDENTFFVDESYKLSLEKETDALLVRLALGFTGGMKYTIPAVGSFFLEFNPNLSLFVIPNKEGVPTNTYKQVFFNINIGYRKEIYW